MTATTATTPNHDQQKPHPKSRLHPLGLGSAVAFVALVAVSFSIVPTPPGIAAADDSVARYFVDNASDVRLFALVQALAAVAFLAHVCWLASRTTSHGRGPLLHDLVLGAGLVVTALSLLSAATAAALAFGIAESASPAVTAGIHQLADLMLDIGDLMITVVVGTVTYAAVGDGRTPRWLTGLGAIVAGAWAVGAAALVATDGPFAGATGPYGSTIVALLILWMLANATRRIDTPTGRE